MVDALYFDGQRAARHQVQLGIERGRCHVTGVGIARDDGLESVVISDRIGATPRTVQFADGAHCEVQDVETFGQLLATNGVADSRLSRWERSTQVVSLAAVALVFSAVLMYLVVLPAAASAIVSRMPSTWAGAISESSRRWLDRFVLQPTRLPIARRVEITTAFNQLRLPISSGQSLQVVFRRSEALGPNAFALPSGLVIVTDELVWLARDDREILGVLAHEAGHVARRHVLRQLAQRSMLAVLLSWYVGDVSTLAATAPTVLLTAKYSRDFERDADAYAAAALSSNGIALSHLAAILERMDALQTKAGVTAARLGYLSSHPATSERLAELRR